LKVERATENDEASCPIENADTYSRSRVEDADGEGADTVARLNDEGQLHLAHHLPAAAERAPLGSVLAARPKQAPAQV
jgi:hypothetical protein